MSDRTMIPRRKILLGTALVFGGCGSIKNGGTKPGLNFIPSVNLSKNEYHRLQAGEGAINIDGRIVSKNNSFRGGRVSNAVFSNCIFDNHFSFDVNFQNVAFLNCEFLNSRWEGGHWDGVTFKNCRMRGKDVKISIFSGSGSLFEDSIFEGTEPPLDADRPNALYWYGAISTPGHAKLLNCTFNRILIKMDASAHFVNCKFDKTDVRAREDSGTHSLTVEDCFAKDVFGMDNRSINEIMFKNSDFEFISAEKIKCINIFLDQVKCKIDLNKSSIVKFKAINSVFAEIDHPSQNSLGLERVDAKRIELIDCRFAGNENGLSCRNDKAVTSLLAPASKYAPTIIEKFYLKNTSLNHSNFNSAVVKDVELDCFEAKVMSFQSSQVEKISIKKFNRDRHMGFSTRWSCQKSDHGKFQAQSRFHIALGQARRHRRIQESPLSKIATRQVTRRSAP